MRIIAISDTHHRHKDIEHKIGSADVIVHSGDATGRGQIWAIESFLDWYSELEIPNKIFVPGNHDWGFETEPALTKQMCQERGITLLIDEGIEIDGIKFWGSPMTPWFCDWAFNRARGINEAQLRQIREIKPHWDLIPDSTDVLITHGPPLGILDELIGFDGLPNGQFVGCEELLRAVQRVKPQIHIFGHIHCAYGEKHVDGTSFYNASICGEDYKVANSPHFIQLF